jgi:putative phosphoribosyl transferase
MGNEKFKNRRDAGQKLAAALMRYKKNPGLLVLGLPRGGITVAYEVAVALEAPLDVLIVRKLGVPGHLELAMGAVATGGIRILNESVIQNLRISTSEIERSSSEAQKSVARLEKLYRGTKPAAIIAGQTVIVVDDGLATGATMQAAIQALKRMGPGQLVIAVPVASPDVYESLKKEVYEIICLLKPERFKAVGEWYEDFTQTQDEEVQKYLENSKTQKVAPANLTCKAS